MKLKTKKLAKFSDKTGSLIPLYYSTTLENFNIKRFFFIEGGKKHPRADHAHKKCDQIYIPVKGKILIKTVDKKNKKKDFSLDSNKKKILFIPKYTWTKILFLENKSKLLILCNYKYDRSEYIENIDLFLKA
tara:strand:- start:204 stop:599 length:396 start_codon:yes stop_codon:yes gene_type:complete